MGYLCWDRQETGDRICRLRRRRRWTPRRSTTGWRRRRTCLTDGNGNLPRVCYNDIYYAYKRCAHEDVGRTIKRGGLCAEHTRRSLFITTGTVRKARVFVYVRLCVRVCVCVYVYVCVRACERGYNGYNIIGSREEITCIPCIPCSARDFGAPSCMHGLWSCYYYYSTVVLRSTR